MDYLIVKLNKILVPLFVALLSVVLTISVLFYMANENQRITDLEKVNYHRRMIAAGSISSLVTLGEMYEKGQGVEKNLSKAQELFRRAIKFEKLSYSDNKPIDFSNGFFDDNDQSSTNRATDGEKVNINDVGDANTDENSVNLNATIVIPKAAKIVAPQKNSDIKKTKTKLSKSTEPKKSKVIKSIARTRSNNTGKLSKKIVVKSSKEISLNKKNTLFKKAKKISVGKVKSKRKKFVIKKTNTASIKTSSKNVISYKKSYPKKIFKMKKTPAVLPKVKNKVHKISTLSPKIVKKIEKDNFTTDPCSNESSKYIARCIRLERMKRFK